MAMRGWLLEGVVEISVGRVVVWDAALSQA